MDWAPYSRIVAAGPASFSHIFAHAFQVFGDGGAALIRKHISILMRGANARIKLHYKVLILTKLSVILGSRLRYFRAIAIFDDKPCGRRLQLHSLEKAFARHAAKGE